MEKIVSKLKWPIHFLLWILIVLALFGLNLGEYVWVMIKKRKTAKKIIYFDLVQTWKEKVMGHPKIVIRQYENFNFIRCFST